MFDLMLYYVAESDYLTLFIISLLPILMAPLAVLVLTHYIFHWFDPTLKMTAAKMFMFVSLAVIISLLIMLALLYIFLPPGTDFRYLLLATVIISGLLGAGRLYLVEPEQQSQAP